MVNNSKLPLAIPIGPTHVLEELTRRAASHWSTCESASQKTGRGLRITVQSQRQLAACRDPEQMG